MDLAIWRGDFPDAKGGDKGGFSFGKDYKALQQEWRMKGRDFLKCDLWYWQRLAELEPVFGKNFQIGDMDFDGNDAKFNAKQIREALQ